MTVDRADWERWLDPTLHEPRTIAELLQPPPDGSLDIHAVSRAVNNVRTNSPDLIEPIVEESD